MVIQGSDKFVYVIENNQLKKQAVSTGKRNFGKVEILSGLNEDKIILAEGTNKARPGKKVKIISYR